MTDDQLTRRLSLVHDPDRARALSQAARLHRLAYTFRVDTRYGWRRRWRTVDARRKRRLWRRG